MSNKEIAISVKDLHIYYRDMKRFSIKRNGFKDKGSGKLYKAIKGVTFDVPKIVRNVVQASSIRSSRVY